MYGSAPKHWVFTDKHIFGACQRNNERQRGTVEYVHIITFGHFFHLLCDFDVVTIIEINFYYLKLGLFRHVSGEKIL